MVPPRLRAGQNILFLNPKLCFEVFIPARRGTGISTNSILFIPEVQNRVFCSDLQRFRPGNGNTLMIFFFFLLFSHSLGEGFFHFLHWFLAKEELVPQSSHWGELFWVLMQISAVSTSGRFLFLYFIYSIYIMYITYICYNIE